MTKEKKPKFEAALKRLEEIVAMMEDEKIPLDDALALYEEGVRLAKFCAGTLDAAEKKIEILSRGGDGGVRAVPFLPGQETESDAAEQKGARKSPRPPAAAEPEQDDPGGEKFLF